MNQTEAALRIVELTTQLDEHSYNYYALAAPTLSDEEFDRQLAELVSLE